MSKNNTLSIKKQRAIETLATSGNVAEAARAANVSRKTLYRWLRQSDFTEALEVAAQESLANLSRELAACHSYPLQGHGTERHVKKRGLLGSP